MPVLRLDRLPAIVEAERTDPRSDRAASVSPHAPVTGGM
jgi:hypothetical protein